MFPLVGGFIVKSQSSKSFNTNTSTWFWTLFTSVYKLLISTVFVEIWDYKLVISNWLDKVYQLPTFAVVFQIYARFVLGASGNVFGGSININSSFVAS